MKASPLGVMEHVGLVMEDLAAARVLFHEKLALPVADYPESKDGPAFAIKVGRTIVRVASGQSIDSQMGRRGVNHVAFKVDSFAQARERLAQAGAVVQGTQTSGSGGRQALWSDPETTIGIPLQFVQEGAALEFKAPSSAPFIERIDHLGIAAESGDRARSVYVDGLGWPLESTQTDSEFLVPIEITSNDRYGARSHSGTPIPRVGSGLIALFVTVGDFDLEIMQPLGTAKISTPLGTIPGSVGQDQGAIAQALHKRGEGLLHIGFKVPDIREAIARVTKAGIDMIDPVARPGSRNGYIAFMNRHKTERVLLHFIERTPL